MPRNSGSWYIAVRGICIVFVRKVKKLNSLRPILSELSPANVSWNRGKIDSHERLILFRMRRRGGESCLLV